MEAVWTRLAEVQKHRTDPPRRNTRPSGYRLHFTYKMGRDWVTGKRKPPEICRGLSCVQFIRRYLTVRMTTS